MNSKERLSMVIRGEIPDCIPVSPDTSNMIPAKLTGKPFWNLYLYNDPPIWKAYIDCAKYFGFDALMDGYVDITVEIDGKKYDNNGEVDEDRKEVIVFKSNNRIVTQYMKYINDKIEWSDRVNAYYMDNPPTHGLKPESIGLQKIPEGYEEIKGRIEYPEGEELLKMAKEEMGDHGLVGVFCGTSCLIHNEEDIYAFYDDPEKFFKLRDQMIDFYEKRFHALMSFKYKPDFICTGYSGSLIFQTPEIFEELSLPIVKRVTQLCRQYGIPSHLHSCGPETDLIRLCHEHTDITVIDPLELPPMGDCDLKSVKEKYGDKIVLKGNLHTTNTMLMGSREDVVYASKKAIDEAGHDGKFILSTGDQCGRDTPFENIFAMIETARTYGRY